MDYDLLYPGRFMKSGEFEGKDRTLTISAVRVEELEQDKGGLRGKGIVTFAEEKKEWVLNKTNGLCLKALWGRETNNWIGKRVTLFPAPHYDSFTKTQGTAIRVKGSPDLTAPLSVVIKLRKKKDTTMTLVRTGASSPVPAAPKPMATSPMTPAQHAAYVARARIRAALTAHGLSGRPALAFVLKITGKAVGHDANDASLIETALAAEAELLATLPEPPSDPEPPPPSDADAAPF